MESLERIEGELANRGVVPGRKVVVTTDTATVAVPAGRPREVSAPRVELVRDGDVIQAIDVTCGCGQKIRLRCQYDEAPTH